MEDLHALSGAYALDALPREERGLFEEHLARCETCHIEVRGLRETAALLGAAVAERPPAALRMRVLNRIHDVRQEPPVVAPVIAPVVRLAPRWARRLTAGLAAVSTAAAAVLGVVAFDARRDEQAVVARGRAMEDVLAASDAVARRVPITGGGSATIVRSASKGQMIFASADLRPLGPSQTYEMWLIGPDGTRPAGLVDGGGTRTAMLALPAGAERFGVTVEPAGGSAQPTTTPILLARV